MSEIRIAVIGADQLDLDHRHALNALSDSGRIAVYALETDTLEDGREALQRAVDLNAIDAAIIAGRRINLAAWIAFALETGWPVYTPHPVTSTLEEMIEIRRSDRFPGSGDQQGIAETQGQATQVDAQVGVTTPHRHHL